MDESGGLRSRTGGSGEIPVGAESGVNANMGSEGAGRFRGGGGTGGGDGRTVMYSSARRGSGRTSVATMDAANTAPSSAACASIETKNE
jgi:hypothetical protein